MEIEYAIQLDGKTVGQACVTRQGLYCHFTCRCRFSDDQIYRIMVRSDDTQTDLGICVPANGWFVLNKSVPAKRIGEGALSFFAEPKNKAIPFIPVDPDKPFNYISKIENARFQLRSGQPGVLLTDRSASRPGSDPSP